MNLQAEEAYPQIGIDEDFTFSFGHVVLTVWIPLLL
jgi:hypothetical protein